MDIEHTLTTPKIIWIPLTICLALASISTKFAGAAWAWLLIAGLVSLWITRISARDTLPNSLTHDLARTWLMFTALAFLLKAIPMLYWHDPWAERHAELRLLLGAVGLYGITRLYGLSHQALRYLAIAGIVYCAAGLVLMLLITRDKAPTNVIPWAAGVSFVSCWLLSLFFINPQTCNRWFLLTGCLMGLLAVLLSQTRGAYGLVLILPAMAVFLWLKINKKPLHLNAKNIFIYVSSTIFFAMFFWSIKNTALIEQPMAAINNAVKQFHGSQASLPDNYNTSIGARLYLWSKSVNAIIDSPWIGYGHDGRVNLLLQWEDETKLAAPKRLGHVHNEYLHSLLDHGIFGLLSFLTYFSGLIVLILKLKYHQYHIQAIAIFGILFMHMSTALSNVNFAHNYYPTVLSLVVCIILWSSSTSDTTKAPKAPLFEK
jgi:O-antigen ligase